MRLFSLAAAGLAAACLSSPAAAEDTAPCDVGMVCASKPETVIAAMEKAGFKPKLVTDTDDDPMIESDEASYHFEVYFYGCKEHRNCDSLRFEVLFKKEPENTVELANKWNSSKRFLQMSVKSDGKLGAAYDLATIGGVNAKNFADVLDWWSSMLGELGEFFDAEVPKTSTPAAKN